MRKSEHIVIGIVVLSALIGAYLYPQMPERMASHWNASGQVDGYMSKFWGVFLMPLISMAMFFVFLLIPKMDPKRSNIEKFRKYFDNFIILLFIFLLYVHILTLFWNLGSRFSIIQFLMPAFAALFFYAGVLTENAKMNWSIGIRTPWTLSNEKVWDKTNKLGGKLFKFCGLLALIGMLFPDYSLLLFLVPILFSVIYVIVYSYLEYKKSGKK